MSQAVESTQDEVTRRHRATVRVIVAAFAFTLLLVALALSRALGGYVTFDPTLANALRFAIVFLGVGAVAFRRTRFSSMRIRDIGALRGARGLLDTLQTTTMMVALIGAVIALLGFVISIMTDAWTDMLWLGGIAVAVLVYGYPRRAAWQSVVDAAAENGDAGQTAKGTIA